MCKIMITLTSEEYTLLNHWMAFSLRLWQPKRRPCDDPRATMDVSQNMWPHSMKRPQELFELSFGYVHVRVFCISKMNYDFIQVSTVSLHISCNVIHIRTNGQYWKLHMSVVLRIWWFKHHRSFEIWRVNFLALVTTFFFQKLIQIRST